MRMDGFGGPRVLLVDDSREDAEFLLQAVMDQPSDPVRLQWVTDLDTAIDRLEVDRFDAVLLDLGLERTSGLETLERFFERTPRDIPVVVLTHREEKGLPDRALRTGAQDYLVKGRADTREILRAIRYAMARKAEQAGYEEALRRDLEMEHIEAESAFKTRFLNLAAHELATPLTPLLFQVTAIRSDVTGELTPAQAEALEIMDRGLSRLSRMLDDIMLAAQLEVPPQRLALQRGDLSELVATVVEEHRPVAKRRGVTLSADLEEGLVCQIGKKRLAKAIAGVLEAGINRTPEEGEVQVTTSSGGDVVRAEVVDEGEMVTSPHAMAAFEPYAFSVQERNHDAAGTGLGLYLAKEIVALHGGTLRAKARGGMDGVLFVIELPVA